MQPRRNLGRLPSRGRPLRRKTPARGVAGTTVPRVAVSIIFRNHKKAICLSALTLGLFPVLRFWRFSNMRLLRRLFIRLRKSEVTMKHGRWIGTATVILLALLGTEVEASATMFGDSSGDAMQRYNGMFGRSLWPYFIYPPAPSLVIVNVQDQIRESDQRPPPLAAPRFWTARCGIFVELEVSPKMNLMEEERKPCSPTSNPGSSGGNPASD